MLKKVSPGEPFRPRSSAWNEVIDKVSVTSPIPRTLPSLMPSQAMAMVEANTPAFVPVKLDPNPVKNSTSPDVPSYQLATESTTGEAIIGITLESSGAVNKPIRVCIQGVTYAKVTADPELDPNVTPPFAVYDSENETLKTSMDYARIRILQFDSAKPSLISIDNESTLLSKSSASETAPVDINRQSIGNISGLSFGTNLSCGVNAQEKQALAVDIGTRTTCTYEQTSSDGCTTETVTFEMSGEHALAIDGGLRVLLADEQRGSSQEYTDPTTGITSNGGPDKFVGGGLRITFDDPIPETSGITTPGLSIRIRDEQVGEPNQYYPDVLRHNANGLYIAPEAESCAQGLDVMLTTNDNFGTMMPGKGLAVATSEITETAEDGTQTTTIIPNYGVVDVQVCECTCLKINEANEIEFTGNINYEGGIAINVNERTINLQVCQGNGLIVNADNQLQYTGSGGGSSISPCQCSGQWLNNGIFGVKVAGRGECYYNQLNALSYVIGCYYNEAGTKIGTATDVLSVLVDPLCGLTLNTAYKSIQVKVCTSCGIDFNASGELVVTASGGGLQNLATGTNSLAVYSVATTSADSVTIGCNANGSGTYAVAVGRNAIGSSTAASALGYNSNATGIRSTAFGYWSQATASDSTAIGNNSKANGGNSIAIGNNAWGRANVTTAIGFRACTNDAGTTVFSAWDNNSTIKTQLKIVGKGSTIANNCTDGLSGLIYEEYDSSGTIATTQAKSFADLFASSTACQCSGLWVDDGEFGVKVAGGVGNCYNNMVNALTYTTGCYYDEAGNMLGSTSGVLAVLVDKNCGLDVGTSNQSIKVKVDQTTIGYGSSGELTALTGISSVIQASGVPEEGQNGWVTTMYHPMLYHCGSDAIISYRQLMRVANGKLEVSHQRAFMGGGWQEYFGA